MTEHVLKTWPNVLQAVKEGRKRFEWRKDDRGFEVGDVLVLRGYNPHGNDFENAGTWDDFKYDDVRVCVTYIARGLFDIPHGYCIMSIEKAIPNAD